MGEIPTSSQLLGTQHDNHNQIIMACRHGNNKQVMKPNLASIKGYDDTIEWIIN